MEITNPFLYEVAVDAPLHRLFTYKSQLDLPIGQSVEVFFGKRKTLGIIINKISKTDVELEKLKEIETIHPENPILEPQRLEWMKWISDYYIYPVGQTLQLCFPPIKKTGRATRKKPIFLEKESSFRPELTQEQSLAAQSILNSNGFKTHLLFGVTGSGKTEVYLEVLETLLKNGKTGLVLVPEISLTPQLIRRFSERFGERVAVIHSQLTEREKTNQWWSVIDGEKKILIGARSALFCPIPNLGIIIIDEEHESSFKQDEKLKYHARDSAIVLAKNLGIPVCLGSATPSLESWKNAIDGKFVLHKLTKRVTSDSLATIETVDLRKIEKKENSKLPQWMSEDLYQKIEKCLLNNEQVALFLNRRGLSQVVLCPECGANYECPNCDISLSLHAKTHLNCHYCGYHEDLTPKCKKCGIGEPKPIGIGTEKVEEDIQTLFSRVRTIRMDRDEVNDRESLENAISKIENSEVDIIIGTQMIAKGLDFKKLTLVGIILADIGFNIPDFRTAERNFQLLTQVAGRAGRHSHGEVVIQTLNPEYSSLIYAQNQDFEGFANFELAQRQELLYPPFGKIINIRLQSLNLMKLKSYTQELESVLYNFRLGTDFQVLGPAPSPIFKLKNKYRFGMLIKGRTSKQTKEFYLKLIQKYPAPSGVQVIVDVDPMNTFA